MVKLRKAFALMLSGVILTSPAVVGQNSQNVECPTMTFSTAEIVYGPEGLSKVAPINAEDNQVLSDFLSTRKEWDDRFSTAAKPLPYVDLAIAHAGVVPATVYTFGKLVIGQQLDVLKKENAELERAVIANLVAQPSYNYEKLALAKQASEQMKNPQILDDEFSRQSGLSKTNWSKMTPEERDDALRIVTSKSAAELGSAKSQIATKASKDEVFLEFAQLNLQQQKMGESLVELQQSTRSIVQILHNNLRNETVLRAASLYLSGQITDDDMQTAMKKFGVKQDDINALRSKKDLQSFQTGLQYATAVGALANRLFPNSDFAKITGQIASAAAYVSVITKAATGDFLGAAAGLLGIMGPGDQGNAQIAQQLAQLTQEIHQLRQDIWEMHGDLVNRINALFVLNTVTLQAVNLILKQDLEECRSFLDSRAEPQFAFDPITGRFPNLNALAVHFSSGPRPNEYGRCRAFLDKRIRPSEAAVQFFGKAQLANNALAGQTTGRVVSFDDQLRSYRLFTEYFDSDPQARVGQFLFPSSDYQSLREKMDQSSSANVAERFRAIPTHSALDANNPEQKFFYRHFPDTISPLALLECVDFELRLAPYSDLIDENPSPHLKPKADIKRLLEPGSREVSEGVERIKRAMDLVDLAIAQQAWLGGDALLPELSEEVSKPVTTGYDPDLYKSGTVKNEYLSNEMNRRALAHLAVGKNNPLLLQNVIRYQIYESMNQKKYNSFAYAFAAYHKEDPVYMNDLIGEKLTAKWEDDPTDPNTAQKLVPGWYLTFSYFDAETGTQQSDPLIPLPSVQDARTLSFAVSSDMRQLLEARERLKALLLGYQFVDYARNGKNGPESLGRLATYSAANNERLK